MAAFACLLSAAPERACVFDLSSFGFEAACLLPERAEAAAESAPVAAGGEKSQQARNIARLSSSSSAGARRGEKFAHHMRTSMSWPVALGAICWRAKYNVSKGVYSKPGFSGVR